MNGNKLLRKFGTLAAMSVTGLTLASCQYLARQDLIEPYTGDAVNRNLALQAIDPWPPYVYDTRIPTDGQRQADAVTRYKNQHEKAKPQELAPVQLVVPQSN